MKLIDLLVRDLPKRGGWPEGCVEISQDTDGSVCIWKAHGARSDSGFWGHHSGVGLLQYWSGIHAMSASEDAGESIITREQYEAVLAESKMQWDGEGFPPVGCECEYKDTGTGEWMPVEIKYSSSQIVVFSGRIRFRESAVEISKDVVIDNPQFRPIRSEADKKRAKGVIALSRVDPNVVPFEYGDRLTNGSLIGSSWYELYDAIAAGKVDGIKLED